MNALPPVVDRILSCFAVGIGFPENYFKEVNNFRLDAHTELMASTSNAWPQPHCLCLGYL